MEWWTKIIDTAEKFGKIPLSQATLGDIILIGFILVILLCLMTNR